MTPDTNAWAWHMGAGFNNEPGGLARAFDPSTREAESSTLRIPGQQELHGETLCQKARGWRGKEKEGNITGRLGRPVVCAL